MTDWSELQRSAPMTKEECDDRLSHTHFRGEATDQGRGAADRGQYRQAAGVVAAATVRRMRRASGLTRRDDARKILPEGRDMSAEVRATICNARNKLS
jgi:hypothetical protein